MWKTLAGKSSALGEASYAHKQAAMFERLQADCEKLNTKGLEKSAMYKQWYAFSPFLLSTHANGPYPILFIGLLQQLKNPASVTVDVSLSTIPSHLSILLKCIAKCKLFLFLVHMYDLELILLPVSIILPLGFSLGLFSLSYL